MIKFFDLLQTEVESILPSDFIWRNENDIISQIGNLFYIACCDRVNKQIECSASTMVFDNDEWLKNAPWTILNQLFEELSFKYKYANLFPSKTGMPAKPLRMALGSLMIRKQYGYSDRELLEQITESE